jgi:dienelactone hydrolase
MHTADVTLTTADGPMRCYEAVPDGSPRGAVVVIQEANAGYGDAADAWERALAWFGAHLR